MINQEQRVNDPQSEDCSSIGTQYFWNLNDSKTGASLMVFNIVLNVVLMISASLGNGMIIVAILRSQNLQTPSYLLITSLAFSDLLMGLVFHPLQIALSVNNLQGDVQGVCGMIHFYVVVGVFLGLISLLMVACISIDRYLALTLRHRYNIIVTKKRVRLLISFVWIVSILMSLPATMEHAYDNYYIIGSSLASTLILLTSIFYIKSYRALHLYTVQVQAQQPNPLAGNFDVVRYKKTLKTMVIVLGCLVVCSVPIICSLVMRIILRSGTEVVILQLISFTVMGLNSSVNPLLYIVRFADIRSACRETFNSFLH